MTRKRYPASALAAALLILIVISMISGCADAPAPTMPPPQEYTAEPNTGRGGGTTVEPPPTIAVPTPVASPSPAYPGVYTGIPTPNPPPVGLTDRPSVESYVVQSGQTLSWIALVFGCTVEEIVAANNLPNADSIVAGQTLDIPVSASETGPALKLVPDSEMVYGPAYIHFDLEGFVASEGGYLLNHVETVEGVSRTGPQIVQLIAQRFGMGPRVLLALLELRSGWVTQPQPAADTLVYPMGHVQNYHEGLYQQLSWAAVRLNAGYYGWKWGRQSTVRLRDGKRIAIAPGLNPGTAGVQNCLAQLTADQETWLALVGPEGFLATYQRLFGNPFAYAVEPLVPLDLTQPELRLPWEAEQTWYFTGGPHGGWADDNDRAALDFVPGDRQLGCAPSSQWVTAAASGRVLRSENGEVVLDLDGDGFEQSGWVLLYMHVYAEGRVAAGAYVQRGEPIGRPSCEGGYSTATHLHLARRYNGEWIPAGAGPVPMVLSGWTAQQDVMPYEGALIKDDQIRTACECWEDDYNGLVSDNAP
jgi:LysM repeat protein